MITTNNFTLNTLKDLCSKAGLYVDTYSTCDGVTHYRFFNKPSKYFDNQGIFTSLGIREACIFVEGYTAALQGFDK